MWLHGNNGCMHHLLIKDKVVGNKVKKDVQQGVSPTAYSIPECLDRHQFTKGPVKHIYYGYDPFFQHGRKNKE